MSDLDLDINEYMRLPTPTRAEIDAWLEAHDISPHLCFRIRLHGPYATVSMYDAGPDGKLVVLGNDLCVTDYTFTQQYPYMWQPTPNDTEDE